MALRILIIDDSPISRILIKEMVETAGHQAVAEAENQAQALEAYRAHKPDVVTLDLSLVNEDGRVILKELIRQDPQAKVLIVSGNSQSRVQDELAKNGAAGFLAKPVDLDELSRLLSQFKSRPFGDCAAG